MKPFIIALVLLIAVAIFVIYSGFSTSSNLDGIISQLKALPEDPDTNTLSDLNIIEKKWEKHKEFYSILTKFDFIYNFSKEMSAAKSGIITNDDATYLSAKNSMVILLEYIRDIQNFRWDNII